VPTLVLIGDCDWLTPPSASRALAAAIPGAELEVIPEAGHFVFGEQPERFTRAAHRFLDERVPAGVGGT
jgi:pimeloyl-ACP methyl ester carboxylesterase